jgi:hypothetical protein
MPLDEAVLFQRREQAHDVGARTPEAAGELRDRQDRVVILAIPVTVPSVVR